jgi:uncharacterized membrane protein YfhO
MAFGAAVLVYGVTLAVAGVYPFGGKSVLLFDMGNQYAVFHSHYRDILTGNASPFFSWQADLGMNYLPIVTYYLASPFSLIAVFFSDRYIPEAMVLIMLLKIGTGSAAMAALLRRLSPGSKAVAAAFGTTYAVSAWTVSYGFNVMWLDSLYLLPLILIAIEVQLASGRIAPLTAVLAATVVINFYDASLILPFAVLYLLARKSGLDGMLKLRPTLAVLARSALALFIGVAIAGIAAFPTVYGLIHGRTNVLGQDAVPVPVPWSGVFGRMFGGTLDWYQYSPNIDSATILLIPATLFAISRRIPRAERIGFLAIAASLFLASQNLTPYLFWHAGERPNGFPFRFAFLVPAVLVMMGYRAWVDLSGRRAAVQTVRVTAFWLVVLAITGWMQGWLVKPTVVVISSTTLILGAAAIGFHAVYRTRPQRSRRVEILSVWTVAAIVLGDVTASSIQESGHVPYPLRSVWSSEPTKDWADAMRSTAPPPGQFFRADGVWSNFANGYDRSQNESLRYGNFALNHFSSWSSGRLHDALHSLGYTEYVSRVWASNTGETLATDALLGFKYLVSPGSLDRADATLEKSWPTAQVYQNAAVLPLGFMAPPGMSAPLPVSDPFAAQEQVLGAPGLFTSPCAAPTVTGAFAEPFQKNAIHVVKQDKSKSVTVTWQCKTTGDAQLYAWADTLLWNGAFPGKGFYDVQVSGKAKSDYPNIYDNGIHDLGEMNDQGFTVTLTTRADSFAIPVDFVRALDVAKLNQTVATLSQQGLTDVHVGDTSVEGTVTAQKDGTLFLAIPDIYGWGDTKVDGKDVTSVSLADAFVGIPVTAGTHRITMNFRPPGLRLGMAATAFGLLALGGVVWWERRRRARPAGQGATDIVSEPSTAADVFVPELLTATDVVVPEPRSAIGDASEAVTTPVPSEEVR